MSNYACGPYRTSPGGGNKIAIVSQSENASGTYVVGYVPVRKGASHFQIEQAKASAELLAAAPSLLEACELFLRVGVHHEWRRKFPELWDNVQSACIKALGVRPCEGCEGTGVRPYTNNGKGITPPEGFVVVECCDECRKYETDLDAADAWGTDAMWQGGEESEQAICHPPVVKGKTLVCIAAHDVDENEELPAYLRIRGIGVNEFAEVLRREERPDGVHYQVGVPSNGATGWYDESDFRAKFKFL